MAAAWWILRPDRLSPIDWLAFSIGTGNPDARPAMRQFSVPVLSASLGRHPNRTTDTAGLGRSEATEA
jgi:hypothetical protein